MKTTLFLGIGLSVLSLSGHAAAADGKIAKLVQALEDPRSPVVLSAITKLGNYGSAANEAVPALSKQLRSSNNEASREAARALARIGTASVAELVKTLHDPSRPVRARALLTLGTIGREAGAAALPVSAFLKDEDAKVRLTAALVLGAMHEQARPAAPRLKDALHDSDARVRFVAADSLKQIGPAAVNYLAAEVQGRAGAADSFSSPAGVRDQAVAGRIHALKLLGWFPGSAAATNALVEALKDPDTRVRAVAAGTLSRLGHHAKPALPRLLQSLKDDDVDIQVQAFAAVMAIADRHDAGLRAALTALNDKGHWTTAYFPASFAKDPKNGFRALVLAAGTPDPTYRLAAVLTLGRLGSSAKAALPVVQKLLGDRNRCVRVAAYLAVCAIDPQGRTDFAKLDDLINQAISVQEDSSDLVRLHLLLSTMPSLHLHGKLADKALKASFQRNTKRVCESLDRCRFSLDDLPALVEGINLSAQLNLGFTEPFSRLVLKLQNVIQDSRDPKLAMFVFNTLGKGVPLESHYWPALQQQWARLLAKVPIDFLIFAKQQVIQQEERIANVIRQEEKQLRRTRTAATRAALAVNGFLSDFT